MVLFQQMVIMFLFIITGFFCGKKNIISESVSKSFSWIILNLANPALILNAAIQNCNQAEKEEAYDRIYTYFPRLGERRNQMAGTMSGGEQAMLSIGRALVNKPKIMILDEPSEGVQPNIVNRMGEIVQKVSSDLGLTVLMRPT